MRRLPRILSGSRVDYDDVAKVLDKEGVQKVIDPFEALLEVIREESRQLVSR